MERVGIVMLPMIFGESKSFLEHARQLRSQGHSVVTVDLYRKQPFRRPFFLSLVAGNERKNLTKQAEKFNDKRILKNIYMGTKQLYDAGGVRKIFLMGFGMGAIYALWYAQKNRELDVAIDGVIGWYPHLIFPEGTKKQPPHLKDVHLPYLLFYGAKDTKIEPGTIDLAYASLGPPSSREPKQKEVVLYDKVGHAFADRYVQSWWNAIHIPNPLYNKESAESSWQTALRWLESHTTY